MPNEGKVLFAATQAWLPCIVHHQGVTARQVITSFDCWRVWDPTQQYPISWRINDTPIGMCASPNASCSQLQAVRSRFVIIAKPVRGFTWSLFKWLTPAGQWKNEVVICPCATACSLATRGCGQFCWKSVLLYKQISLSWQVVVYTFRIIKNCLKEKATKPQCLSCQKESEFLLKVCFKMFSSHLNITSNRMGRGGWFCPVWSSFSCVRLQSS